MRSEGIDVRMRERHNRIGLPRTKKYRMSPFPFPGMGRGEGELLAVRSAQILGFPRGQHIKAMGADQVGDEHRHVFIQVQAEKQ